MDLFLINGQDGISLPEMIDWDIKLCDSEINEEVGINNILGLGYELPSLDIDEEPNHMWTQSYSGNSNSSFELDFLGEGASALMVNPSSVMPFVSSHRRFENNEKGNENEETKESETLEFNKPLLDETVEIQVKSEIKREVIQEEDQGDEIEMKINVEDLSEQGVTFEAPSIKQEVVTLPVEFVNVPMESNIIEVTPSKKCPPHKRQVAPNMNDIPAKAYPKPAYSYSCLIAMALKNSLAGSLPVSEIYSFMCHHFPYFKTAPAGWKNSVRHNLSLNKCFEKIEKPHSSGSSGSQRKGCLWAMNPAKITKMDDEVAKWSKKDPSAIKKAMVFPDNLEFLERGELKDFSAFNGVDAEEDSEEVKEEEEDVEDLGVEVDDERITPIDEDDSEDEISRVPPSLQPFEPRLAHLNRYKILPKDPAAVGKTVDVASDVGFEVEDITYDVEVSDTRTSFFGLDDTTPIYAVDPTDENMLIELPLVKRPRVQGSYICQPVLNMKRHNISGFRSIKIQSP